MVLFPIPIPPRLRSSAAACTLVLTALSACDAPPEDPEWDALPEDGQTDRPIDAETQDATDEQTDDLSDGDLQLPIPTPGSAAPEVQLSAAAADASALGGWVNPSPLTLYDFVEAGAMASLFSSRVDLSSTTWNTGGSVNNDISSLFVPAGREATACSLIAYRGNCHRFGPNTPGYVWPLENFNLNNVVTSIEFRPLGEIDWYTADYKSNYPNHRNNELSPNIQGVAHSSGHWFIANTHEIARVPITADLNAKSYGGPELHVGDIPGHCDHIGDIDFYSGELFVPLEGCDGGNWEGGDRIAVYHIGSAGNFVFDRQLLLGNQDHAPWVAVNPINGLMYSSDYDDPGDTVVHVYNRNFADGALIAGQLYRVFLPRHFHGVQGGTFDPDGNLYLTDHAGGDTGIYVYQIAGGSVVSEAFIGPNGYKPKFPHYQEIEGIDYWDLSDSQADIPGIDTGAGAAQLHWLLLDNDAFDKDEFYFKHIRLD